MSLSGAHVGVPCCRRRLESKSRLGVSGDGCAAVAVGVDGVSSLLTLGI
jgi:hypothetical protein